MTFSLFNAENYFDKNGIAQKGTDNVIADLKCDFSLKKLENYSLLDTYGVLQCARKNSPQNTMIKLIFSEKFRFLTTNCFYLQEIKMQTIQNITAKRIYLIENIIAFLCSSRTSFDNGWIYVAKHSFHWRIIAGIEKGIILSRFLTKDVNINSEIDRTISYLKRFKLADRFKLFFGEEILEKILDESTYSRDVPIESYLIRFAEMNRNKFRPIVREKFSVEQKLKLINRGILFGSIISVLNGIGIHIWNIKNVPPPLQVLVKNDRIKVQLNESNIDEIGAFIKSANEVFFPWDDLQQIRKRYPKIVVEKLSLNEKQINLYTKTASPNSKGNRENFICIKR